MNRPGNYRIGDIVNERPGAWSVCYAKTWHHGPRYMVAHFLTIGRTGRWYRTVAWRSLPPDNHFVRRGDLWAAAQACIEEARTAGKCRARARLPRTKEIWGRIEWRWRMRAARIEKLARARDAAGVGPC